MILVPFPPGKYAIGCKWVYKTKYTSDGSLERYKVRLVVKGYSQKEEIAYSDTFYLVAKMVIIRTLLAIPAKQNRLLYHIDVLNSCFAGWPWWGGPYAGSTWFWKWGDNHLTCRLQKSLYGLKQPSTQRNVKLIDALVKNGYIQNLHDYSLFMKKNGFEIVALLIYVDDLRITGNSESLIWGAKIHLANKVQNEDLGQLKYFLGIEVAGSNKGLIQCQINMHLNFFQC